MCINMYKSRSPRCQPIQIVKVGGHHVTITSPPPEPEVLVPPRAMIQSTQQAIHYTVPNQFSRTACAFLLLLYIFFFFFIAIQMTYTHTRDDCKRGTVRRLIKITYYFYIGTYLFIYWYTYTILNSNKIFTIFLSSPMFFISTHLSHIMLYVLGELRTEILDDVIILFFMLWK